MRCPNCHGQLLRIEIHLQGFVTAFFHAADEYQLTESVTLTSAWEENSPCLCENCEWSGIVADALACCESAPLDAEDI